MATEPGHRPRRRDPRDEPGARLRANTALRDSARLCRALSAGGAALTAAVGAYEADLREYGYAAVEESRRAEAQTGTRRNPVMFWLYRRLAGR